MLDFASLQAPARHGSVLVAPEPRSFDGLLQENQSRIAAGHGELLGQPLSYWRRRIRQEIADDAAEPLIVIGHQPSFIHPGVWAKHIVCQRFASARGGRAVNLVVDTDAPATGALAAPDVDAGRVSLAQIPMFEATPGVPYEQIAHQSSDELAQKENELARLMGESYGASQMPTFFDAAAAVTARSWVDQAVSARGAIEASFSVKIQDVRVSAAPLAPLLADLILHADTFAAAYNHALADYRTVHKVRGVQRPIPDLVNTADRCEMPTWIFRPGQPRRRLFVERHGDLIRLFADKMLAGELRASDAVLDDPAAWLGGLAPWRVRPRALTLTLWARLLLADLFIHGIGGAKYDRITDTIIADYYKVEPPAFACVTGTLHLDLPRTPTSAADLHALRQGLRDLRWNPQRYISPVGEEVELWRRRAELAAQSMAARRSRRPSQANRRAIFDEIRRINAMLSESAVAQAPALHARIEEMKRDLRSDRIATNREFFFGLYNREALQLLPAALPRERDFGV